MSFDALFSKVYPSLFRYCTRLAGDEDVADDIAQEAFVRMVQKEVVGDEVAVRAWLFKVATHLVRDRVKVSDNRRRLLEANPPVSREERTPDQDLERSERIESVRAALARLDPRDRQILLMREEGFSYKEIAEVIDVSRSSIGTLLVRAQKRFSAAFLENARSTDGHFDD